jgi:hypothetical protein
VHKTLPNPLGAYVRTTLRSSSAARNHVLQAHVHVEEDFIQSTHGFDLNLGHSVAAELDESAIVGDIESALKGVRDAVAAGAPHAASVEARLLMCRDNYLALVALERVLGARVDVALAPNAIARAHAALRAAVDATELVGRHVVTAPTLDSAATTHSACGSGAQSVPAAAVPTTSSASPVVRALFDGSYARRLVQPFPPRSSRVRDECGWCMCARWCHIALAAEVSVGSAARHDRAVARVRRHTARRAALRRACSRYDSDRSVNARACRHPSCRR